MVDTLFSPADFLILKSLALYVVADAVFSVIVALRAKPDSRENGTARVFPFELRDTAFYIGKFAGPWLGLAVLAAAGKEDLTLHALFLGSVAVYAASEAAGVREKGLRLFGQ